MSSVADLVAARLWDAGVRYLFGVPGGGSNLDLVAAAERAGVRFVLTAAENGGAIAAIAQSEITGRPGACLTTLGPGVASVVNGVACARLERAPLLVFTDAPAAASAFEHQRLDHRALLAPVVKWSATITAVNAGEVMTRAIACAIGDPPGPVHLDCPADVLAQELTRQVRDASAAPDPPDLPDPLGPRDPSFSLLRGSTRPLIVVGLGARDHVAAAAIRALCSAHRIPAMVTYKAKGVVPDADPWFAGVFTNGAIERPIADAADLLIAIGLDIVELIPRAWTYPQPVVRVSASHIAELSNALGRSTWDAAELQRMVARQHEAMRVPVGGLAPHRVVQIAAAAAPRARVTVDAGAHMFPATILWPVEAPNQMLISNGLSTMGFAVPAAIGAALADAGESLDRRRVVALIGDGGLLMCAGELVTIVRERLPIAIVVFDDRALSLIDIKQKQRQLARSGVEVGAVDWRALAESTGMCAWTADSEAALADALAAALGVDGPSLIDARIDASGYPEILTAVRG